MINNKKSALIAILIGLFSREAAAIPHPAEDYTEGFAASMTRIKEWQNAIKRNKQKTVSKKLILANKLFNNLKHESDMEHWGVEDYWATPIETLASNGGDCEDIAIGKYFTLRELGISEQCLKLTYVVYLKTNEPHMILSYQCNGKNNLILDSLITSIMSSKKRKDILPVYSFNSNSIWIAKRNGIGQQIGSYERLSVWASLLNRVKALIS